MVSTLSDSSSSKVHDSGSTSHNSGLSIFDNYYNTTSDGVGYPSSLLALKPLLLRSNVRASSPSSGLLLDILDSVTIATANRSDGILSGLFADGSGCANVNGSTGIMSVFDAGRELAACPGSSASKAGELFCSVDMRQVL